MAVLEPGGVTGQYRQALLRPVQSRQAAEQAARVGMLGRVQLGRAADLDDPAGVHDRHPVAEGRHQLEVVADEDQPHAALADQIVEDAPAPAAAR